MSKEAIYKARIIFAEDKVIVISYANQRIAAPLFNEINNAIHEAAARYNGELDWKQMYIRFTHDGKKYCQVDSTKLCEGCCFYNEKGLGCLHPYFLTKGDCTGRIYKEEKQ